MVASAFSRSEGGVAVRALVSPDARVEHVREFACVLFAVDLVGKQSSFCGEYFSAWCTALASPVASKPLL